MFLLRSKLVGSSGYRKPIAVAARGRLWRRYMARVATIGLHAGRPLSLEKIDDTLIKVIARVHDLHLALMFKVLDDLAARRNLLRA